jgi:hypothetical protein
MNNSEFAKNACVYFGTAYTFPVLFHLHGPPVLFMGLQIA